ncbi:hypothetical protein LCGC14_1868700 [marine sediment metagenome]|uniref:Leucine-binding protein domain-containing protein n=1 Tax=marine sediment metagenome TaxID=412755 RepID=A0A0F9J4C8_9ZZZZ
MSSGIGVISRTLVLGTLNKYRWVQIGSAISHPDQGKVIDMNESIRAETGVVDAEVKIYPNSGYGNPMLLRQIMQLEKPDMIMIYTDPRFWIWFFNLEQELRQTIPIIYLNVWDSSPACIWNRPYYSSCDLLACISKQTYGLTREVLGKGNYIELDDILKKSK